MIKIGIHGATGKMGYMILENLKNDKSAQVATLHAIDEFTFPIDPALHVTDDTEVLLSNSDVVIDFTIANGTEALLEVAMDTLKPLVIGTTGLSKHQQNLLNEASKRMPILYSTNMSLGVAILNRLVETASRALKDFDIEIVEQHHRYKKDAPSGTAMTLGEFAAKGRGQNLNDIRVSGRNGLIGARTKEEIAIMSLRGGDVAGRHTVGFYNDGEFIELNHTATSRDTFAKGAIRAAKWIVLQENGLYHISDCLGLN